LFFQLIRAEDSGGLSSTATVNIKVTDINDKNPEFVGLPYVFRVREGAADQVIGSVHADDADEGQNAVVFYSVPEDIPFAVNSTSGEIRTVTALDFEKQRVSSHHPNSCSCELHFFFLIFLLIFSQKKLVDFLTFIVGNV